MKIMNIRKMEKNWTKWELGLRISKSETKNKTNMMMMMMKYVMCIC